MRQQVTLPRLNKKATRRGNPKRYVAASGQQALLRAIVAYFGGPLEMSELIKERTGISPFSKQNLINWRDRKGVPLEFVRRIAHGLNLNEYALNYRDVAIFKGEAPPWRDVVISCEFLTEEEKREILQYAEPKF